MRQKHRAPTMKDVAREAGVSLGTVSKVINGITVGDSYRRRVNDAIQRLGYQVNSFARGLKTDRTDCVALLMPSLRHPFFALLTDALTACLSQQGYRSMLMITNYDAEAEQKCFTLVRQNKLDGVIALTYSPDLEISDSIPVVVIDRHLGADFPCVSSDNFQGGAMAAEKLLALGCRKLLFLRIGPDVYGEADKRGPGFESACRAAGAEYDTLILSDSDTEAPFRRFLAEHIRDGKLDYDGIFCNTDGLAVRIIGFLREQGVDIPGQVQVIGYDGIMDYATGRYSCSTIVQPIDEMAEAAVRLLLDPGETRVSNLCLPVRYAPGGTTRD